MSILPSGLDLSLPLRSVRLYRFNTWPSDASHPEMLNAGGRLVLDLRQRAQPSEGLPTKVILNANRRVSVSVRAVDGGYTVRAHFKTLDDPNRLAMAVLHVRRHKKFPPRFNTWLNELAATWQPATKDDGELDPVGQHVNLQDAMEQVKVLLPEPSLAEGVTIGWGRRSPARRGRRHLRLGRYRPSDQTISIHPILDHPDVPGIVVGQVVFHELCHHVAPPLTTAQARARREHRIHHSTFRALERHFPTLTEANRWIEQNIEWLIRKAAQA